MTLAVGTRFFGKGAEDLARLKRWVEGAVSVGPKHVFVAVNVEEDKCGTMQFLKEDGRVIALPVTPWFKFVMPLNAIVLAAARAGGQRLLLTSAEFPPEQEVVDVLQKHLGDGLVAGARTFEHDFRAREGKTVTLTHTNGSQVPWNTYALWNLEVLAHSGFPLLGDSPYDLPNAGVEEVAAISLAQTLCGEGAGTAKLVHVPALKQEWDMSGWDDARKEAHKKKIASKVSRPAAQLLRAEWYTPMVHHVG